MTEDEFETTRLVLNERQIKLLGSYVRTTLYTRPYDVDESDYAALLDQKLIEPVGGMRHKESFSGERAAEEPPGTYRSTDRGLAWYEWYEEQPKS